MSAEEQVYYSLGPVNTDECVRYANNIMLQVTGITKCVVVRCSNTESVCNMWIDNQAYVVSANCRLVPITDSAVEHHTADSDDVVQLPRLELGSSIIVRHHKHTTIRWWVRSVNFRISHMVVDLECQTTGNTRRGVRLANSPLVGTLPTRTMEWAHATPIE